jgi:RimJ/RimL family protein N-acetyltransferase
MQLTRRGCSMAETILETARLRLRTWGEADIAPFMAALNTPAVRRWLGDVGDEARYRDLFERMQACQVQHGCCFWIVERASDAALLGFCGLHVSQRSGTPVDGMTEIAWRLREDAWGMGYAREAAEASLTYGFGPLGLKQIIAFTVAGNAPSWGLMMRLGMIRARELDHHVDGYTPELSDHIVYKIDKEDWTQ